MRFYGFRGCAQHTDWTLKRCVHAESHAIPPPKAASNGLATVATAVWQGSWELGSRRGAFSLPHPRPLPPPRLAGDNVNGGGARKR